MKSPSSLFKASEVQRDTDRKTTNTNLAMRSSLDVGSNALQTPVSLPINVTIVRGHSCKELNILGS